MLTRPRCSLVATATTRSFTRSTTRRPGTLSTTTCMSRLGRHACLLAALTPLLRPAPSASHTLLVRPLPPGCRLTAIFDSCHSGSAMDLPYIYSTEGKIKEPNLLAEAGQGLMSAGMSYLRWVLRMGKHVDGGG